jgi:hypothetical protein
MGLLTPHKRSIQNFGTAPAGTLAGHRLLSFYLSH